MRKEFSNKWLGSKQPRKQRKYRYNAPLHLRHKMLSVHLAKELRKKYGKRNFPARKDDEVKIMIGEFKGKKGKVEKIDLGKLKISVAGIYRTKKDGSKVGVLFDPSNLIITELNLNDKQRSASLERKILPKTKEKKEVKVAKSNKTKKIKEKK